MCSYRPKKWSLGARALTQKLGKEFIEILEKATEEFLEVGSSNGFRRRCQNRTCGSP